MFCSITEKGLSCSHTFKEQFLSDIIATNQDPLLKSATFGLKHRINRLFKIVHMAGSSLKLIASLNGRRVRVIF